MLFQILQLLLHGQAVAIHKILDNPPVLPLLPKYCLGHLQGSLSVLAGCHVIYSFLQLLPDIVAHLMPNSFDGLHPLHGRKAGHASALVHPGQQLRHVHFPVSVVQIYYIIGKLHLLLHAYQLLIHGCQLVHTGHVYSLLLCSGSKQPLLLLRLDIREPAQLRLQTLLGI